MDNNNINIMDNCYKCQIPHNYVEDGLDCVPPSTLLVLEKYEIDPVYRQALYMKFPFYTTRKIIETYLGNNSRFPSQEEWLTPDSSDTTSSSFSDSDIEE